MSDKHVLNIIIDICEKYNDIACRRGSVEMAIIDYQQAIISIMSICTGAVAANKQDEQPQGGLE